MLPGPFRGVYRVMIIFPYLQIPRKNARKCEWKRRHENRKDDFGRPPNDSGVDADGKLESGE